jgi:CubicO group peptidase (beta-lactamase class C family)
MRRSMLLWLALLVPLRAWAQAGPVFADTGPDAAAYGAARGYPSMRGSLAALPQAYLVGNFSHYDTLYPSRLVAKPAEPSQLRRAADEIALTYNYQGASYTLDDYLTRNPTTGLLIARGDTILFEHYQYARTDHDRFISWSMGKTVTSMLLGIAVAEGAVHSIDQPSADYVPELASSQYGATPIRDLLHMSSGVAFSEVYDGGDDIARLASMRYGSVNPGAGKALAMFNTREAPSGTRFHYASSETQVLGLVIGSAVNMPLAEYLQTRIWQPMGAEADATWIVDSRGTEIASGEISATLRDWARFGLMLAHDGAWNGHQIVPRQWVLDATSVAADYLAPSLTPPRLGYGYQVWLQPGTRRQFSLRGVHGQAIFVDPESKLVLVHTAVRLKPAADPGAAELAALWRSIVAGFGH